MRSYVRTLLERVAASAARRHGKIEPRELLAYVNEHLSRPLYLEDLAEVFHTTPTYVSRYFKKTVGTPFYQYVENRRIEMARDLLGTTSLSVSDVGSRVGILSRNTFLRVFKKVTGQTPSAFRDDPARHRPAAPTKTPQDVRPQPRA
jgi:YesN/AraC family two-component response regulator